MLHGIQRGSVDPLGGNGHSLDSGAKERHSAPGAGRRAPEQEQGPPEHEPREPGITDCGANAQYCWGFFAVIAAKQAGI